MLEKKLFTLACVLAILGIGACFQAPPRPPAVPLPPALAGARVLAIDVRDASPSDPLPSAKLSDFTAAEFNAHWNLRHVRVVSAGSSASPDATLHITILNKQATPGHTLGQSQSWKVILATRMQLVGKDGRQIWLRDESPITITTWRSPATPFSWQYGSLLYDVALHLAWRAGTAFHKSNAVQSPPEHP
ncbi:MAG TPA: hypothetical protein VGR64_01235 [Terracidiphilus sp.]|nr:hypothetical protein [Terracidiphilus sp.]